MHGNVTLSIRNGLHDNLIECAEPSTSTRVSIREMAACRTISVDYDHSLARFTLLSI